MKLDMSMTEFVALVDRDKSRLEIALHDKQVLREDNSALHSRIYEQEKTISSLRIDISCLKRTSSTDPMLGKLLLELAEHCPDTFRVVLRSNFTDEKGTYNKIGAIKLVREMTGLGLKEAKDFVEGTTNSLR